MKTHNSKLRQKWVLVALLKSDIAGVFSCDLLRNSIEQLFYVCEWLRNIITLIKIVVKLNWTFLIYKNLTHGDYTSMLNHHVKFSKITLKFFSMKLETLPVCKLKLRSGLSCMIAIVRNKLFKLFKLFEFDPWTRTIK